MSDHAHARSDPDADIHSHSASDPDLVLDRLFAAAPDAPGPRFPGRHYDLARARDLAAAIHTDSAHLRAELDWNVRLELFSRNEF